MVIPDADALSMRPWSPDSVVLIVPKDGRDDDGKSFDRRGRKDVSQPSEPKPGAILSTTRPPSVLELPTVPNSGPSNNHKNVWSQISMSSLKRMSKGGWFDSTPSAEVLEEWNVVDQPGVEQQVTDTVMERASHIMQWGPSSSELTMARAQVLNSIESFRMFCEEHLKMELIAGYKLKLAFLAGKASTQCPAWHQDHVPVRYLCSLHGRGTLFFDPLVHYDHNDVLRSVMDGNYRAMEKNALMDKAGIVPDEMATGQPHLLIGKTWPQMCSASADSTRMAVLHRSPYGVAKSETRVLLSLDVVTHAERKEEQEQQKSCEEEDCACKHEYGD